MEPRKVVDRLLELLRRHVRADDAGLTDHELVTVTYARYLNERAAPLIDPNE